MKKMTLTQLIPLTLAATALVSCGNSSNKKNPVGDDLTTIRSEGKTIQEMGPQKPVVIENNHVVKEEVPVIKEQATIDAKYIVISHDEQMTFSEGEKSSYNFRVRSLVPGVQVKLVATNLPSGATFSASSAEKDLYVLTWTPDLNTIALNKNMQLFKLNIKSQITVVTSQTLTAENLKNLVREEDVSLFLFHNQQMPSDLKITGLANEMNENTITNFSVTAKVPGTDDKTSIKPRISAYFDGISVSASNNFLELDGSRHVIAKDVVYLGNSTWKFNLQFDTKNMTVQPQLAKDGSFLTTADGTRVRMSFKVYSPFGTSTPETLFQTKIKYDQKTRGNTNSAQSKPAEGVTP